MRPGGTELGTNLKRPSSPPGSHLMYGGPEGLEAEEEAEEIKVL